MKRNKKYFLTFIILFLIEIVIAMFVHDTIIRPYIGDILVILLIYALIRTIVEKPVRYLSLFIFIFAFTVEMAQYFNITDKWNLDQNKVISIVIGSTFDLKDIICYLIGTIVLVIWEKLNNRESKY